MLKPNAKLEQFMSKTFYALMGTIGLIVLSFLPQNLGAQNNAFKNEIAFSHQSGKIFNDVSLQYQRSINSYFSLVGSLGKQNWRNQLEQLENGQINIKANTFGLGAQLHLNAKPSGFFLQANVLVRSVSWDAKGSILGREIPKSSSGNYSIANYNSTPGAIFVGLLFGLLDSGSGEKREPSIPVSYKNQQTVLGVNGKLGYKFITKNKRISFAPSINFESIPGPNTIDLTANENIKQVINVHDALQKARINFGWALGVRF